MSHSLELIKRVLDIKKRKLIWNYSSGNLKSWEGSSVNCCFFCRWAWMTPNIWLKIWKKISQSLEVPPYFQICRWLALSARWGSSFIYVFRILQGSCKDAVEEEGKLRGVGWGGRLLSMSCVPNSVLSASSYINAHFSYLTSPGRRQTLYAQRSSLWGTLLYVPRT